MEELLLTVAIPTFNRAKLLDKCLEAMLSQISDDIKGSIELIVSDNDSKDNTTEIVNKYINKGFAINYYKNSENIGADRNIAACFLKAKAKYVWVFSDDDFILPGYLKLIFDLLKSDDIGNIYLNGLWFNGSYTTENKPTAINYIQYDDPLKFIDRVNYWSTFNTGNILNKSLLANLDHIPKFYDSNLVQLSWILPIVFSAKQNIAINDQVVACMADNTGGYKLLTVFGKGYNDVLKRLVSKGMINKKVIRITNNHLLQSFFPMFINKSSKKFENENGLSLMVPIFWSYKSFWKTVFPILIKKIIRR